VTGLRMYSGEGIMHLMPYRSLQTVLGCACYKPREEQAVHNLTNSIQVQPQIPGKLMLCSKNTGIYFEEKINQKAITC